METAVVALGAQLESDQGAQRAMHGAGVGADRAATSALVLPAAATASATPSTAAAWRACRIHRLAARRESWKAGGSGVVMRGL
ncbi:MAG: hypothetical protein U0802_07760 [Candidatus Binatia bacterium]